VAWVRVRLLGPVDVVESGVPRPIAGLRRKAVLAVLGLSAGEVVSTERLIDVVWDGRPPRSALNTLQGHMSYLRGVLGDRAAIVARAPGYVLDLGGEATDLQVATGLIESVADATDPAARLADLRTALALWRGRPLADVAGLSWLDSQADRLAGLRLEAVQALVEVRLGLAQHAQVVPQLQDLVDQHPHHELFARQLMLALYRCGRQADALAVYQRLRTRLAEELGIDPGGEVREMQAAILRHEPALAVPEASPGYPEARPVGPVPRQLPADVSDFTGRVGLLADLDARLDRVDDGRAVVISAVSGTAGVGKTTLAVHWAHRVAHLFADGQLYVNLRGFDPAGPPTDPGEALRGFLEALGGPGTRIPTGLDAQAALYRSLLAGRRVLVVLDNARDVEQVRPLLPAAATCLVVVTSRNQLSGLVADGAHPLLVDLLSLDEARDLLQQRLGKPRVTDELDAVDAIVEGCTRLPLALSIAAARAALQPQLPLRVLAAELRRDHDALSALDGGDPSTDIRAVFSWSYRQLSPAAGRVFRLLGLHPGPDVSAAAVSGLAAVPAPRLRPLLAELTRASLIVEHRPGRYTSHDLLRAYAAERARGGDREERAAATVRMLDHYLHTAHAANRLIETASEPPALAPAYPDARPEHLPDGDRALAWLDAEQPVLVRLVTDTAATGYEMHAWQLARAIAHYLFRRGNWRDCEAIHHVAIEAGQRLGDPAVQARAHCGLANVYARQDRVDLARNHLRHALDLSQRCGDLAIPANANYSLAYLEQRHGRYAEALHHTERARDLYRAAGHRHAYADTVNAIGWLQALRGDHEQSLATSKQALALLEELDDHLGQAASWYILGFAHHHLGHHREAVGCYERALQRQRERGDRNSEVESLSHLGDAYHAMGDLDAARRAWQQALDVLDVIDHTDADIDRLRAKLAGRNTRPPS
jgi:DNA-binding SARP family transcriptional activator/tetratricopeptide (TPR) repeat protein